jgi:hypothetical protein
MDLRIMIIMYLSKGLLPYSSQSLDKNVERQVIMLGGVETVTDKPGTL